MAKISTAVLAAVCSHVRLALILSTHEASLVDIPTGILTPLLIAVVEGVVDSTIDFDPNKQLVQGQGPMRFETTMATASVVLMRPSDASDASDAFLRLLRVHLQLIIKHEYPWQATGIVTANGVGSKPVTGNGSSNITATKLAAWRRRDGKLDTVRGGKLDAVHVATDSELS